MSTPSFLVMAALLLSGDPETPERTPTTQEWGGLSQALIEVATDWELIDRQQAYFTDLKNYQYDIKTVRERRIEGENLPRVWESNRFPSYDYLQHGYQLNQKHVAILKEWASWKDERWWAAFQLIEVADALRTTWELAAGGKHESYSVWHRRQSLGALKARLTPEEWATGHLPLPIP